MSRLLACSVALVLLSGVGAFEAFATSSHAERDAVTITQLERRVAILERRMALQLKVNAAQSKANAAQSRVNFTQSSINSLTASRLGSLENTGPPSLQTSVQFSFTSVDGASATAFCPPGQKVVGGGGEFIGQAYYSDHLLYSYPNIAGTSWTAAADGPVGGRSFEVYAVCATNG
jgi:uncharacterized coiled-coil protein SlyX